jgi:hypothetical protein
MKKFTVLIVVLALLIPAAAVFGDEAQVNRYVEMLRQDVRDQKEQIIREAMKFKEGEGSEAAAFWNVYRAYQKDLAKVTDVKIGLIKDYAQSFDTMTQAKAKDLAKKALANEKAYFKLKEKYYDKFMKALGPSGANRFFQVENALNNIINLKISSELPLFPQRAPAK